MKLLAIETSCDETSVAVVEKSSFNSVNVLSNVTASSVMLHAQTGGIIPENAAREQVKWIIPVIIDSLLSYSSNKARSLFTLSSPRGDSVESRPKSSRNTRTLSDFQLASQILKHDIDAIAVTYGPGLIGSLLVGVETAKTLAYALNKPLIPVNHLLGHLYANWLIADSSWQMVGGETAGYPPSAICFPVVGLIVSGGHTDLLHFDSIDKFQWLGGTRDDAAGEALDKIGRLLGLSYPAGPEIEKRADLISETKLKFQSPLIRQNSYDFSFSGLKTEVLRFVQKQTGGYSSSESRLSGRSREVTINENIVNQVCYATQKAIIDVLVYKTLKAAQAYNVRTILLGGGVSANQTLIKEFEQSAICHKLSAKIFSPEKIFCTDNAAMIGAYALINYKPVDWHKIKAEPELYFD